MNGRQHPLHAGGSSSVREIWVCGDPAPVRCITLLPGRSVAQRSPATLVAVPGTRESSRGGRCENAVAGRVVPSKRMSLATLFSGVDLPAPLGSIKPTTSPDATVKLTPSRVHTYGVSSPGGGGKARRSFHQLVAEGLV